MSTDKSEGQSLAEQLRRDDWIVTIELFPDNLPLVYSSSSRLTEDKTGHARVKCTLSCARYRLGIDDPELQYRDPQYGLGDTVDAAVTRAAQKAHKESM